MLKVENMKIQAKILKLQFEIEQRQTKLNELQKNYDENQKIINSTDNNAVVECIKCLNKDDAKLFIEIEKLPEEKRKGWSPKGYFKCNLCLQTFKEGFNNLEDHVKFFRQNPNLVHLSKYYQKHTFHSICIQNRQCSHCEETNAAKRPTFTFRTQRDRHLKKHQKDNIRVRINRPKASKEEIIQYLKNIQSAKFTIGLVPKKELKTISQPIPNSILTPYEEPTELTDSSSTAVEDTESDISSDSSRLQPPIIRKVIKRKIIKPKIIDRYSPTTDDGFTTDCSLIYDSTTTIEEGAEAEAEEVEIPHGVVALQLPNSREIYNFR